MHDEIKGIRGTVTCPACGNQLFSLPDDEAGDPSLACDRCRTQLGPIGSLRAAANGQAYTFVVAAALLDLKNDQVSGGGPRNEAARAGRDAGARAGHAAALASDGPHKIFHDGW